MSATDAVNLCRMCLNRKGATGQCSLCAQYRAARQAAAEAEAR